MLSFAAVLEDTSKNTPVEELPHIHVIINRDYIQGEPYALDMNKDLITIIKEGTDERLVFEENFSYILLNFLENNNIDPKKIKVVGKNFNSFDKAFIKKVLDSFQTPVHGDHIDFHRRVLDLGSVMVDFKNDEWVPNLQECKNRAGVKGEVIHDALEDARDVIKVLRTKY